MKRDLDRLMKERGIDALAISGTPNTSRDLFYFTGPIAISGGRLIKKVDEEAILVANSMERDEAAKSGLKVMTQNDFGLLEIVRSAGNPLDAGVRSFLKICEALDVRGTVSFYGTGDIPGTYAVLEVRSHEVPYRISHGQPFCKIQYTRNIEPPLVLYGDGINSNYQCQRLSLSKQFKQI